MIHVEGDKIKAAGNIDEIMGDFHSVTRVLYELMTKELDSKAAEHLLSLVYANGIMEAITGQVFDLETLEKYLRKE